MLGEVLIVHSAHFSAQAANVMSDGNIDIADVATKMNLILDNGKPTGAQ